MALSGTISSLSSTIELWSALPLRNDRNKADQLKIHQIYTEFTSCPLLRRMVGIICASSIWRRTSTYPFER
eukprot:8226952-Pyramimonas_sp.AAC.1